MSSDLLCVLPRDPLHRPEPTTAAGLVELLQQLAPGAERVAMRDHTEVQFVDAGENFEHVSCPRCGAALALDWWSERLLAAADSDFRDLATETPCCAHAVSLNDLDYFWPQGFARWWVEAESPSRGALTPAEVLDLEGVLGMPVTVVWAHY